MTFKHHLQTPSRYCQRKSLQIYRYVIFPLFGGGGDRSDYQKLCPLIFTVPIIDDSADVLMIDMMTLLDLEIRQETDFSVVSQDKIFE